MPTSSVSAGLLPGILTEQASAEFRLRMAMRVASLGFWEIDLASRVVSWSPEAAALHARTDAGELDWTESLAGYSATSQEALNDALQLAHTEGLGWDLSVELTTPAGETRWLRHVGEIQSDPDGRLFVQCALQDITSLTQHQLALSSANAAMANLNDQFEQAINRAQQFAVEATAGDEAKSLFLATMSHEIRTPLNGIIGMTCLLEETPLNDEQQDCLRTIKLSGEALLSVINDTLDYSKIEAGQLEIEQIEFNPAHCVHEAAELLAVKAHGKGLEIVCLIEPGVPRKVFGDANRLRQILVNLISNAVKFTAEGEIVVSLGIVAGEDRSLELTFRVRDTGIGIPPDKHDRLFRSFSQVDSSTSRKYGGTGLGLAISKKLAGLMGGRMWVESEEGRGSTFAFTIQSRIAQDNPTLPPFSALRGAPVLIVTDLGTHATLLQTLVTQAGGQPVLAPDAAAAEATLREHPAIAAILLDHRPPQLDATTLAEHWRSTGLSTAPVLALGHHGRKLQGAGVDASLIKPIKAEVVVQQLSILTGANRPAPARATSSDSAHGHSFATTHPLRILMAEDNAVNQKVGRMMLGRLGYEVTIAQNGEEAIALLRAQTFDVVLMDLQMPVLDGLAATERIRAENIGGSPWIVALTAGGLKSDRETTARAGMNDYLSKPVKLEDLREALLRVPIAHAS